MPVFFIYFLFFSNLDQPKIGQKCDLIETKFKQNVIKMLFILWIFLNEELHYRNTGDFPLVVVNSIAMG